ncbi:acyltransferase family protein [Streptomyces californicus]|uniref:acyltransferase family protein n=1 Tax=Streptomyces californicus TaxID=67351 RepID=UPI0036AA47DA
MFQAPSLFQRTPLPPETRKSEPRRAQTLTAAASRPAPGAEVSPAPAPSAARKRDPYFDNVKYLAIVLVAVAHAWEPVMDGSRATRALYMVVYAFHMPAFILISGYFSRTFDMTAPKVKRLITGVVVPYVLFETAYSLFKRYADDSPDTAISLIDPFFLTWFLVALFIWRVTTPIWLSLRHPLPVALAIAVLASVSPEIGDDLDLQRVLQFLPFFVLGLLMKPEHFRLVRRREVRILAVPLFAGALLFAYWVAPRMQLGWLYRANSAQEMDAPWWSGAVMTLAMFGCALALTIGFLAWVPGRARWFTALGAGTICGYLLHGFLIKGAEYAGLFDRHAWLSDPIGLVVVTLTAAAAVTLMCTPRVGRALKWATEPDMSWAFRKSSAKRRVDGPPTGPSA